MAKVTLDPAIKSIRGKMGGYVFKLSPTGKQIMTKRPDMSNVKWSKAQKEHRQKMKKAVAYAKAAMADEQVHRRYEKTAKRQGKRPFDLAVSDYFKGKNLFEGQRRRGG